MSMCGGDIFLGYGFLLYFLAPRLPQTHRCIDHHLLYFLVSFFVLLSPSLLLSTSSALRVSFFGVIVIYYLSLVVVLHVAE